MGNNTISKRFTITYRSHESLWRMVEMNDKSKTDLCVNTIFLSDPTHSWVIDNPVMGTNPLQDPIKSDTKAA